MGYFLFLSPFFLGYADLDGSGRVGFEPIVFRVKSLFMFRLNHSTMMENCCFSNNRNAFEIDEA